MLPQCQYEDLFPPHTEILVSFVLKYSAVNHRAVSFIKLLNPFMQIN